MAAAWCALAAFAVADVTFSFSRGVRRVFDLFLSKFARVASGPRGRRGAGQNAAMKKQDSNTVIALGQESGCKEKDLADRQRRRSDR